jgi:F-type H+/Na+-transporting ATPase subunit alpha
VLGQRQFAPLSLGEQVALLFAVGKGMLDDLPLDEVEGFRGALGAWLGEHCPEVLRLDDQARELSQDMRTQLANLKELVRTTIADSSKRPAVGGKP